MKIVFNAILKFIAFILAGILILALPLSLLVYNTGEVLFDQESVNRIAAAIFLDSDIIPAAMEIVTNRQAEEISQKIEDTDQPEGQELDLFTLVYSMEEGNWKNFREALLSDQVLGGWIKDTVNGFYHWLDNEEPIPQIRWNMTPLIEYMEGPEGEEAIEAFYNSLPDCTDLQMEEMKTHPGDQPPRAKMVKELCKLSTFLPTEQIKVYSLYLL